MFELDISRAQVDETLVALAIAVAGLVVAWIVARLTRLVVHSFTHSTRTDLDDGLADALRGPFILFIALQGIHLALRTLSYLEDHRDTIEQAWFALMILVVVFAVRRVVIALVEWFARRPTTEGIPGFDSRSMPFMRRILNVVVVAIGLLLVLDALGVSISPLLAGLGIGGLAVALALQPLLSNVFASSYVITDSSVAVGDYVEVDGGPTGVVEDIGWRATRIRTFDNNVVLVPNSTLADSILTNFDSADARSDARVDCGIAYEEDLAHVEQLVLEEMNALMDDLEVIDREREPLFRYAEFGDSNINFFVKMRALTWADSFLLKHEMMKRIHARLGAEGIVINYPARRLLLDTDDVPGLDRLLVPRPNGS
jgi:small-conductance mechanosensitive channel